MDIKSTIESLLNEEITSSFSLSGGCISNSQKLITKSGKEFFLKTKAHATQMFHCEANGLKELAKSQVIQVPQVVAVADIFLLLEYIPQGARSKHFFEEFGRSLAHLHRFQNEHFGFYEDNYIGATPQLNLPNKSEAEDWAEFYFNKRLLFQYKLAEKNGYVSPHLKGSFSKLESKIGIILSGVKESPCLLHGDLWVGNFLCHENGRVVLIDPAVYHGHRETDLAMTKLFGGFTKEFYEAYNEEYPLSEGWQYRENIYKLYHVLNHLNLFGTSYLPEVEQILKSYLP